MAVHRVIDDTDAGALRSMLGERNVVLVGLMGAGKTAIGRKIASRLGLPFVDSDQEIEHAARMTIPDIFERYGEPEFRALEERVLKRLLSHGPQVVATGGGAFMNADIRAEIVLRGVSVWLNADLDTLMERVVKKKNRPLLRTADPRAVMQRLMDERYPVYGQAEICVVTRNAQRDVIAEEVLTGLAAYLRGTRADATAGEARP